MARGEVRGELTGVNVRGGFFIFIFGFGLGWAKSGHGLGVVFLDQTLGGLVWFRFST